MVRHDFGTWPPSCGRRDEDHRGLGSDAGEPQDAPACRPDHPINGEQAKKLAIKLGEETVAIASRTEGKTAEGIKALGEAPSHAAETATAA